MSAVRSGTFPTTEEITAVYVTAGTCNGEFNSLQAGPGQESGLLQLDQMLNLLWHPLSTRDFRDIYDRIVAGEQRLDLLIVEGAIISGCGGRYDMLWERPKYEIILELIEKARWVMAVGTCAVSGGIVSAGANLLGACGLSYTNKEPDGLLPAGWRSALSGLPVINVPGCPATADAIVDTIVALLAGELELGKDGSSPFARMCMAEPGNPCGAFQVTGNRCIGCNAKQFPSPSRAGKGGGQRPLVIWGKDS